MKYLSVCSGIEAATVAWEPLGWEPVGFSEIERFPSSVLAHHYPGINNFGDMNDYSKWPDADVNVLVGGTPCQSFSVAGLREGMADPRGNLALVYLSIAHRYRPRWLVWENVPGVLSSHRGADFGSIIRGMVELGYCPTWRVLDAKNFGVPQRRRRVFIVASIGDWRDSAKVLLEPACMRGNTETRGGTQKSIARNFAASSGSNCLPDVAPTIEAMDGPKWGSNQWVDNGKAVICQKIANPLTHRMHKGINSTVDEGQTPIVVHGTQDPIVSDKAHPLQAKNGGLVNAVAFAENQRAEVRESDKAMSLGGAGGKPGSGYPAIRQDLAVRRLTPIECERLQGFPDNYTDVPGGSDTARYKALGNSMAVPVMRWIGDRISWTEGGYE